MRRVFRCLSSGVLALTFAVAAGCFDIEQSGMLDTSPPSDEELLQGLNWRAQHLAAEHLQQARAGRRERGIEDEILRIEAEVPGFGGFYFDGSAQRFVVFVRDEETEPPAVAAARELVERITARHALSHLRTSEVVPLRGVYGFSELVGWKDALLPILLTVPGFLSIAADESRNRIRVVLEHEELEGHLREVLAAVGVPEAAVIVEPGVPMRSLAGLQDRVRPVGGGMQIEFGSALFPERCSAGWTVSTAQQEFEWGFLTAGHCSSDPGEGDTGETIFQAEHTSSDSVGVVQLNAAWDVRDCEHPNNPSQDWDGACTDADALFVGSLLASKRVARTSSLGTNNQPGSLTISGWWTSVDDPLFSVIELNADKVGRTTGWTRGAIAGTCESWVLQHPHRPDYVVRCLDRVVFASVGAGDSGGPVFFATDDSTSAVVPLGVVGGGGPLNQVTAEGKWCEEPSSPHPSYCTMVFSPWDQIEMHLGRTFIPSTPDPPLAVSIDGPDEVQEHVACMWTANVSGGSSPYQYEWLRDSQTVSTSSSYQTGDTGDTDFLLELLVVDSDSGLSSDQLHVTVEGSGQFQCT